MKYIYTTLTTFWFIFMTYLSHQNGTDTAQTSLQLAESMGNTEMDGDLRTYAHVLLFLVFAVLVMLCLKSWNLNWRWVLLIFAWAIIDEATKIFIDGRHFSWTDVRLNMIGSVIGIVIGRLLLSIHIHKK